MWFISHTYYKSAEKPNIYIFIFPYLAFLFTKALNLILLCVSSISSHSTLPQKLQSTYTFIQISCAFVFHVIWLYCILILQCCNYMLHTCVYISVFVIVTLCSTTTMGMWIDLHAQGAMWLPSFLVLLHLFNKFGYH